MKRFAGPVLLVVAFLAWFWITRDATQANSGGRPIVKERLTMMKGLAAEMKTLRLMVQKKKPFDGERGAQAAIRIADGGSRIPDLFPRESVTDLTRAKSRIHDDWDRFSELAGNMRDEATHLADAARKKDLAGVAAYFQGLSDSCKACHREFRRP